MALHEGLNVRFLARGNAMGECGFARVGLDSIAKLTLPAFRGRRGRRSLNGAAVPQEQKVAAGWRRVEERPGGRRCRKGQTRQATVERT